MRYPLFRSLLFFALMLGLSKPSYAQETFESLRTEHPTDVQEIPTEDQNYWQDYRDRWHSAVDTCQSQGLNPGQCNSQHLVPLRQEAIDRIKSEGGESRARNREIKKKLNQAGVEGREAVRESYLERLEQRQTQAKNNHEDRREDRRDRREDIRDRREDRIDRHTKGTPVRQGGPKGVHTNRGGGRR